MKPQMLLCAFLITGVLRHALAETILLNDGRRIEGQILKKTNDKVIVDLGFEVLSIPSDRIQEIKTTDDTASDQQETLTEDLYSIATLPYAAVSDLAPQVEEAVVKIMTPAIGGCSGFIINPEGYAITNFHCIEGETKVTVHIFVRQANDYRNVKIEDVRIVATNSFMDLALLKFDVPETVDVTYVPIDDRDDLVEGQSVFAVGNPLGLERTVSQGIVSKKNRRESDGLLYVQTTTQINPGNSGGPLFNNKGEVVGVTNAGYLFAEGLNYAIPARYVIDFLKNRDAYAYDLDNPETGHQYIQPSARVDDGVPTFLQPDTDGTSKTPGSDRVN